jgi:hypothetical protein
LSIVAPTEVIDTIAGPVKSPGVEFQADDGEDEDGEGDQKADLQEGLQCFENGLEDDLKA